MFILTSSNENPSWVDELFCRGNEGVPIDPLVEIGVWEVDAWYSSLFCVVPMCLNVVFMYEIIILGMSLHPPAGTLWKTPGQAGHQIKVSPALQSQWTTPPTCCTNSCMKWYIACKVGRFCIQMFWKYFTIASVSTVHSWVGGPHYMDLSTWSSTWTVYYCITCSLGNFVTIGFNFHCYCGTSLGTYMLENSIWIFYANLSNKTNSPVFLSLWLWRQLWLYLIQTQQIRVSLEHTHKQGSYQSVPQPACEKRSKPEEFSSILLSSGSFFLGTLLGCWAWRGFSSGAILLGWGMISWANGWGDNHWKGFEVCQRILWVRLRLQE